MSWKVGEKVAINRVGNGYLVVNAEGAEMYFGAKDGENGWSFAEVVADEPMIEAGGGGPHGTA